MDENNVKKHRAWIEINSKNLENNIIEIQKSIPTKCKIMAVLKANAYGHGIIQIGKCLNKIGITDFAVATITEGINLRQNNIKGNILILGYTHPDDIKKLIKYNLMQTIIDYDYAQKLNNLNSKIMVHIGINTGMNRNGENYQNIDNIIKIYEMQNLDVKGIYSHLCVADSSKENDINFTINQINNFETLIKQLKEKNIKIGKAHIQSSYGLLNYPKSQYDYVRTGSLIYGIYNTPNETLKLQLNLKPVLTLKSRITSIKEIEAGETVGYGRLFEASSDKKIASVSIGFADGYPRDLSNKNMQVKINNKFATIIGRICMDQLMIDISNIENVQVGDIVTLIGNEEEISAMKIAEEENTITCELLSRFGNRVERIIV